MTYSIITHDTISRLARPCSADNDIAEAFIAEAQRCDIKPRIGDALFAAITDTDAPEERFCRLLNGGRWIDSANQTRHLTGLKTALAYYTLARITRDGNIHTTAYGSVVKDDQYSVEAEASERQRQYRELYSQADAYMAEVIEYLQQHTHDFPEFKTRPCANSAGLKIKIIKK